MDYGKLAYLKAVDLEGRKLSNNDVNICYITLRNIAPGEWEITDITSGGDAAAFINCTTEAVFYVNGTEVCKGKNVFFKVNGGGKITAKCDVEMEKLDFMAIGDIDNFESFSRAYVDYDNGKIGYIICENGRAKAYTMSLPMLVPSEMTLTKKNEFIQGDICATEDGFVWALIDKQGAISAFRGNERYDYNIKAEKVAINYDFGLTVAYVDKGALYYFVGEFGMPVTSVQKLKFGGSVDDVRFVKKGSGLLFSSGGKCYIKELNKGIKTSDKLCIELKAEVL